MKNVYLLSATIGIGSALLADTLSHAIGLTLLVSAICLTIYHASTGGFSDSGQSSDQD